MPTKFTGPYARRALVITASSEAWDEWCGAHREEYGAAFWLLDAAHLAQWDASVFDVVAL